MPAAPEFKDSRIDLCMTSAQKDMLERAALISGVSLSEWSLSHLIDAAQKDIAQNEVILLSTAAFDEFVAALEDNPTPQFDEFAKGATQWED